MSKKPTPQDGPPSLVYADEWVDKLRAFLPETVKTWDAEAIHHSRVATRRLRAALDVLEPVLSKGHRRDVAKVLRTLRRRLGPLRDLDVMLGHLTDFRATPGVDWLREQLTDDQTHHRKRTADRLDPTKALAKLGTWWAVRQEWTEAGEAVDGLLANSVHLQLDAFAEHANGVTNPADKGDDDRDPHELRIAGKALRYTLEMAVASGHPLPTSVARAFKRMQDALGAWHDMVVLAERAMQASLDVQLAFHDAALHLSVMDVARVAVVRSQRHLAAFGALWAKRGESLSATIRATFPVVSESQTDPDLFGSTGTSDPVPPTQVDPVAG